MSATLDGIELDADQDIRWVLSTGASPYIGTFEVSAAQAAALVSARKVRGSVLRFAPAGGAVVTIGGLTIVGVKPCTHPDLRLVVVADARWTWRFRHIYRRWNVRATTGNYARVGDLDAPLAVKQLAPDEAYRAWSIDGNTGMTFLRGLFDVLTELEGVGGFVDETGQAVGQAGVQVGDALLDDVLLNDRGDNAVSRLLSSLGAIDIHLTEAGNPVIRNRLDDGERVLVGLPALGSVGTKTRGDALGIGPAIYGEPLFIEQDRSMERANRYGVLFDREIELRLDFEGDVSTSDDTTTADDPPIRTRNVLPVPDESIVMPDGRIAVQGTWVPIEDYIAAKAGTWFPTAEDYNPPDLTLEVVRKTFMSSAGQEYCALPGDEGGVNQRAISAIFGHYRTTFQIEKVWRDRLAWWRPHLVSVVDPKRATFADSPVFCDHAVWLTWRGTKAEREGGDPDHKGIVKNVLSAPAGSTVLDSTIGELKRAPAILSPVDRDAGVFSLRFRMDATGQQLRVLPCALDADRLPTSDPSGRNLWLQWGELTEDHQVSVVVTVGMGAPNNNDVLHLVELDPQGFDISRRLGRQSVGECKGPMKFLRVDASQGIAARFAWLDSNEQRVRSLFGGKISPEQALDLVPVLINGDDLIEAAKAAVAADLSGLLDHVEGSLGTYLTSATPKGTASIEHRLAQGESGGAITTVICPPDPPRVDMVTLMPDAVRKRALAQLGAVNGGPS